jgi:hypothetical protein
VKPVVSASFVLVDEGFGSDFSMARRLPDQNREKRDAGAGTEVLKFGLK